MDEPDAGGRRLPQRLSLDLTSDYWEVTCPSRYSGPAFLTALARILPGGLTLYMEGTSIAPAVVAYVRERSVQDGIDVAPGTLWPRPITFRMALTPENVAGLVRLMDHLATDEVADHLVAYSGTTAYLIWYDAWFDSPLYLRKEIGEESVKAMVGAFGCSYRTFSP